MLRIKIIVKVRVRVKDRQPRGMQLSLLSRQLIQVCTCITEM